LGINPHKLECWRGELAGATLVNLSGAERPQKGDSMNNPKRKVISAEIETSMSNKYLKLLIRELLEIQGMLVFQVQVNEIKKEK